MHNLKILLVGFLLSTNFVYSQNQRQNTNDASKAIEITVSDSFKNYKIIGLPCPNSTTRAGGPWSYEEAGKRKNEIFAMQQTKKYLNWKNPTTGGAVHINLNDEIEVYQFTIGIFQSKSDTSINFSEAPKDTFVVVTKDKIFFNVQGFGGENETSVLLTSEIDIKKSKAFKQIMDELWKPGIQLYYLKK
jgi:hypothetical protein